MHFCRFYGLVSPSLMNAPANSFEEGAVTSIWAVGLILGFSVTDAPFTNAKHSLQQPKPVLTLLVRDLVGLDPPIRNIARDQVTRILDQAGIGLRWIDASGSEDPNLASTTYITVVIAALPPNGWTTLDAMGFAPRRTGPYRRAYVFSTLIAAYLHSFTLQRPLDYGIVLGHVIAHELGHVLISGDAHGDGIMRPNWGYREWEDALKGTLLFPPTKVPALREGLQPK
jgi:hypothetical protein